MNGKMTYLGCCVAAALFSSTVAAQSNENVKVEDGKIERISVTASKRKTYLMETPGAITAISQDQLTRGGIKELRELTTSIPNTQFVVSGTDSGIQASIRGVRSGNKRPAAPMRGGPDTRPEIDATRDWGALRGGTDLTRPYEHE